MSLLRDQAPKPLPKPRKPAYPRVIEMGMLLLLGACSKTNEASQDIPPPPPAGIMAVPMEAEAPLPPPSASASLESVDAGVPEAGSDAGAKDAATKQHTARPPIPSPPGGIRAPFDEQPPRPKPAGSR